MKEAQKKKRQRTQKEGVLHDGTYVYRHFGEWATDSDGTRYIFSDPRNYPEIAASCVPTKLEWETKYKHIADPKARLTAIMGTFQSVAERIGQPQTVGELMGDSWKKIDGMK